MVAMVRDRPSSRSRDGPRARFVVLSAFGLLLLTLRKSGHFLLAELSEQPILELSALYLVTSPPRFNYPTFHGAQAKDYRVEKNDVRGIVHPPT